MVSPCTGSDEWGAGVWAASWIGCPRPAASPVFACRRRFTLDAAATIRVRVSGDERYKLYLDGELVDVGPQRADAATSWPYATHDWTLAPGEHVIVALVWALGHRAPSAQTSVHGGEFFLAAEAPHAELLSTGQSPWTCKPVEGFTFTPNGEAFGTGPRQVVDGSQFAWGFERGEGDGWLEPQKHRAGRSGYDWYGCVGAILVPQPLPAMIQEERRIGIVRHAARLADAPKGLVDPAAHDPALHREWESLLVRHIPVTIAANSSQRIIVDLDDYYCGYIQLVTDGGAGSHISIHWAESLFSAPEGIAKGHRDHVDGKYFRGLGNQYIPDGGAARHFEPLWWEAGRYLEVRIQAGATPLTISQLGLRETRYPLEVQSRFHFSDERLDSIVKPMVRTLQMCSHETYMDCPYYEQLMYVGDTRTEVLATYALTADDRLPRRALELFDSARIASGLVRCNFSLRSLQFIPGFALWWIGMVYDYALWRGDPEFVRKFMPGVRMTLDRCATYATSDGVLATPDGWHFVDWVPTWLHGTPAARDRGVCGIFNWQFVLMLRLAGQLERWLGESELAERWDRLHRQYAQATQAMFWDKSRELFADDTQKTAWSQHAQCLAILSGALPDGQVQTLADKLLRDKSLAQATIYFSHYLFDALAQAGRGDAIPGQLDPWFALQGQGFRTVYESPGEARSDCHAWGSHPLYHYAATLLGIRPAGLGFESVQIRPQIGAIQEASGRIMHPTAGPIEVSISGAGGHRVARVVLPPGLSGEFELGSVRRPLKPGVCVIEIPVK